MAWKPVPLPDGSYQDASRPFSDQDVVNYWTEYPSGQGTRSNHKLVQLPGLRPFLDFGAGPHRGIRNVEGILYLCADTHAYRVDTDGTVSQLGSIPGRGRVWINHNQNDSGAVRQVMFSTGPEAWIYDVASETYTQVSDDAFHGARSLIYLNSRFLGIEQQRRYFANSYVADGTNWDSTETYQAESAPDRLVALEVFAGEVLAFNERTLEFFQNTTNPADIANHIYFTRVGPPVQIGAASPHGVSVLDNRVFFVGSDGAGYYMSGYTPIRITTPAIDTAWAECELSKCFAFTYISRGHSVWYVTFPDGHTWGYDCATQKWHRRQTIGLDRWRLNTLVAWNGDYYGGAYNSGVLYKVDWTYEGLEGCDEIVREFTTGVLHDEGNRVELNGLRIECDTGNGTSTCVEPDVVDIPSGYVWMAVSSAGEVALASEDGDDFALIASPTANELRKLIYAPGYWLTSSADDSKVYSMPDGGSTWTDHALTPACDSFNDLPLAYSPAVGVVVGRNTAQCYTATLASLSFASTVVTSGSTSCQGAAANDTVLLIGDNGRKVSRTTDGVTYTAIDTAHNSGADIYQVKWAPFNEVFLTVAHVNAGADLCSSPTGLAASWTGRHTYAGSSKLGRSVCETPTGGLVFVGDAGIIQWTATLGGTWADATTNPLSAEAIIDVDCHPVTGRIIAVATSGKMAYSDDGGANFTLLTSPFNVSSTVQAIVCALVTP